MPGRKLEAGSGYRYGFNGKENDKDICEGGQDYGMRIYDGRLGRFKSLDPLQKKFPWYTPYQFAGNSPIAFTDLDGLERHYYIFSLDASTGQPVLQNVVSQTHEAGFWNGIYDDLHEQYLDATKKYTRKTEYNGDLITDCSEVYVLQSGIAFKEFSSFSEMKTTTSEAMNKASAGASDGLTAKIFYGDMALHYYSMPSDFFGATGGSDYWDPFLDNKFGRYTPELYPELFPRYDGIKVTESVGAESTVSGKPLDVGMGELKGGVLTTAIYMKDGNTGDYLLKKGGTTGVNVFDNIFKAVKAQGGVINTIQGNWTANDNLAEFNNLIKKGLTPEAAAGQTFTGKEAGKRGYNKVSIDPSSKQNKDGTYEKAVVNFTQ